MWLVMSRCCAMFAVEEFCKQHPQEFATLTKVLVNRNRIHYKKEKPAYFAFQRGVFSLGYNVEIINVHLAYHMTKLRTIYYQAR